MICFRDKTFCSQSATCGNEACPRNFDKELQLAARLWWKGMEGSPPIAFSSFPDCLLWKPEVET